MKLKAFCLYDVKSELYAPPFFQAAVGQALRAFAATAQDPASQVHMFPDDFKLVEIGEFDQETGEFAACRPHGLGFASEFVSPNSSADVNGADPRPVKEVARGN